MIQFGYNLWRNRVFQGPVPNFDEFNQGASRQTKVQSKAALGLLVEAHRLGTEHIRTCRGLVQEDYRVFGAGS